MPDDPGYLLTITVTRSGGFAGLIRTWTVTASSEAEAEALQPLVDACPWPADDADTEPGADRFVYRVTVDDAGAAREATLPESAVTGPWQELIEQVRDRDPKE